MTHNIFNGILSNENNVTEILKNLLYIKVFRDIFFDFLVQEKEERCRLNSIDFNNIDTQVHLDISDSKHGIIDLFMENQDGEKYLIEVKTNNFTPLTTGQRKGDYLKFLKKVPEGGKLFFLIPENYHHKDDIPQNTNIKYWQVFLRKIRKSEIEILHPFIQDFVDYLYNYWSIDKSYHFSNRELQLIQGGETMYSDKSVPALMKKLVDIVMAIHNNEEIAIDKKKKYMTEQRTDGFGYFVSTNSTFNLWYGIDFDVWEEKEYPLIIWIECDNNRNCKSYLDQIKKLNDEYEEYAVDEDEKVLIMKINVTDDFKLEEYQDKILKTKNILDTFMVTG